MALAAPAAPPLDLASAVQEVVAALQAAGLRATADQRNLNPPAVYVAAPTVQWNRLGGYTLAVDLFAVVPAAGRAESLAQLGPLVAATVAVWPATYGYPVDLPSLDGGDPLPAYRLPIPVAVS